MDYHFDVVDAKRFGTDAAVFIHNLRHWIVKNKTEDINNFDNRTWSYSSWESLLKIFPFWEFRQLRYIVEKLKRNHVIVTRLAYVKDKKKLVNHYAFYDEQNMLNNCKYIFENKTIHQSNDIQSQYCQNWQGESVHKNAILPILAPDSYYKYNNNKEKEKKKIKDRTLRVRSENFSHFSTYQTEEDETAFQNPVIIQTISISEFKSESSSEITGKKRKPRNTVEFENTWKACLSVWKNLGSKTEAVKQWYIIRNKIEDVKTIEDAFKNQVNEYNFGRSIGVFVAPPKHFCRWLKYKCWENYVRTREELLSDPGRKIDAKKGDQEAIREKHRLKELEQQKMFEERKKTEEEHAKLTPEEKKAISEKWKLKFQEALNNKAKENNHVD